MTDEVQQLRESTARAVAGLLWRLDELEEHEAAAAEERKRLLERVAVLEARLADVRDAHVTGTHRLTEVSVEAAELRGKEAVRTEATHTSLERQRIWVAVGVAIVGAVAGIVTAIVKLFGGE